MLVLRYQAIISYFGIKTGRNWDGLGKSSSDSDSSSLDWLRRSIGSLLPTARRAGTIPLIPLLLRWNSPSLYIQR